MSPSKLSEADKNQILQLYRETEETTATLSNRFGVSSSTISRFLKNQLSDSEYEDLIQQKRLGRTAERQKEKEEVESPQQLEISLPEATNFNNSLDLEREESTSTSPSPRRRRRRAPENENDIEAATTATVEDAVEDVVEIINAKEKKSTSKIVTLAGEKPIPKRDRVEIVEEVEEIDDSSMVSIGEMLGEDLMGDDLDEDFDDDEEDENFDYDEELEMLAYDRSGKQLDSLQILPFDRASVPRTCYLVVDRMAELITRPLKEFGDLGTIPNEDVQAKTLPVFDNHRVARRFSHRTQRAIKVPDAPRLLGKTSSHLQAKGIAYLLLDGKVYRI